jgi:hypothetical protein
MEAEPDAAPLHLRPRLPYRYPVLMPEIALPLFNPLSGDRPDPAYVPHRRCCQSLRLVGYDVRLFCSFRSSRIHQNPQPDTFQTLSWCHRRTPLLFLATVETGSHLPAYCWRILMPIFAAVEVGSSFHPHTVANHPSQSPKLIYPWPGGVERGASPWLNDVGRSHLIPSGSCVTSMSSYRV